MGQRRGRQPHHGIWHGWAAHRAATGPPRRVCAPAGQPGVGGLVLQCPHASLLDVQRKWKHRLAIVWRRPSASAIVRLQARRTIGQPCQSAPLCPWRRNNLCARRWRLARAGARGLRAQNEGGGVCGVQTLQGGAAGRRCRGPHASAQAAAHVVAHETDGFRPKLRQL